MDVILSSIMELSAEEWIKMLIMWAIGGLLIFLAIKKNMEPTLLLPMGFGAILVNLPMSGALDQIFNGISQEGPISALFRAGIDNELFPLLLFIGIGAMIDFGPLISNPKMFLLGAAAQFGIFFTFAMVLLFPESIFSVKDAASISIIGAADGPTSIFVAKYFDSKYLGSIVVAAYSYMALVPIVQPPVIKMCTTKKERLIRMKYEPSAVPKAVKILFPIIITIIAGIIAPQSVALVGFLMFGNLLRECGVLNALSETAQHELANLVTILLGLTVSARMQAQDFLCVQTLLIMGLGLIAFVFDTIGGVFFCKILNIFFKNKINPMVGAAGISAFPMASRTIQKMGQQEDPENHLLMHAAAANISGQIASVIAGGLIIALVPQIM